VKSFRDAGRPLADMTGAVGNTPLVKLRHASFGGVDLYAKLEGANPGGSVKDRAALFIIRDAIERGHLREGMTLVDSTSGNTGIAYSWIGARLGIPVALVMQESVTEARKQLTRAFGAEQIFSDPELGSDGAIRLAQKIAAQDPSRYFLADQYSNESNPRAHFQTTAPELWAQTNGSITHFVAGIGTGGTIMGTGRRLRQLNPNVKIIAVEPAEPKHGLDGLKHMATSMVPAVFKAAELDKKLSISTDQGWEASDTLGREEGLFVGHSGGAAFVGACAIAERLRQRGERGLIVVLFPDMRERYFSAAPPRTT
jgi:cysteine synthase B